MKWRINSDVHQKEKTTKFQTITSYHRQSSRRSSDLPCWVHHAMRRADIEEIPEHPAVRCHCTYDICCSVRTSSLTGSHFLCRFATSDGEAYRIRPRFSCPLPSMVRRLQSPLSSLMMTSQTLTSPRWRSSTAVRSSWSRCCLKIFISRVSNILIERSCSIHNSAAELAHLYSISHTAPQLIVSTTSSFDHSHLPAMFLTVRLLTICFHRPHNCSIHSVTMTFLSCRRFLFRSALSGWSSCSCSRDPISLWTMLARYFLRQHCVSVGRFRRKTRHDNNTWSIRINAAVNLLHVSMIINTTNNSQHCILAFAYH